MRNACLLSTSLVAATLAASACASKSRTPTGACTAQFNASNAGQPATITVDTATVVNSFVPKLVFGARWVTPEPNDADDLMLILHASLAVPRP